MSASAAPATPTAMAAAHSRARARTVSAVHGESSQRPRSTVAAKDRPTPPDAWKASAVTGSAWTADVEQAQRVALHRPHPAQRRPAGRPFEQRGAALGIDDGERAVGRSVEAGGGDLGCHGAIGTGDEGPGGEARSIGGGQPTGIRSSEGLEDHDLGEQPGVDAAQRLREVEPAEREPVEHGEHRRRPPAGRLVLADVRCQLAVPEPLGRRPELLQLGRELEATHVPDCSCALRRPVDPSVSHRKPRARCGRPADRRAPRSPSVSPHPSVSCGKAPHETLGWPETLGWGSARTTGGDGPVSVGEPEP